MSVSLALEKRRARKGSSLRLFPHVPIRSVPLIVIGLMDANRGAGLGRACRDLFDWPHGLWKFLAWTLVFMVWPDMSLKSSLAKEVRRLIGIAGLTGLVWLAVVFRNPNGRHFTTSWRRMVGQLGWAYLFASLSWLVFPNNHIGILGILIMFHCMSMDIKGRLFPDVWMVRGLKTRLPPLLVLRRSISLSWSKNRL